MHRATIPQWPALINFHYFQFKYFFLRHLLGTIPVDGGLLHDFSELLEQSLEIPLIALGDEFPRT